MAVVVVVNKNDKINYVEMQDVAITTNNRQL